MNAALKSLDDMVKRGGYGVPIGGSLENLADIAEEMSDDIRKGIAQDLREHNQQKGKASTEINENRSTRVSLSSDEAIEEENIREGTAAVDRLIEEAKTAEAPQELVVRGAMRRTDLGPIDLVWGIPGTGKNFKRGYGLSHIIAKRNAENGNGEEVARKIVEVIAKAKSGDVQRGSTPGNERTRLYYDGYTAVLSKTQGGNSWLLTGWENNESAVYAAGEGHNSSGATADAPTFTRRTGGNTADSENSIEEKNRSVNPQSGGSASIEIDPEVAAQFSPEAIARRQSNRTKGVKGERKVSRVRSNTYEYSGLYNEVEAQMDEADEENYTYDPVSEKKSMNEALGRLKADFDGEVSRLSEAERQWGGSDLDTAMGILHRYRTEGRATGDYGDFWRWSKVIQEKGTKGGQFIQAFAKYTRTGTGAAMKGAKDIHDRFKLNPAQQKQVDAAKKKLMDGIDGDMNGAAQDAMKQAKGQKEPGKKQDGKVDKKKLDAEVQRQRGRLWQDGKPDRQGQGGKEHPKGSSPGGTEAEGHGRGEGLRQRDHRRHLPGGGYPRETEQGHGHGAGGLLLGREQRQSANPPSAAGGHQSGPAGRGRGIPGGSGHQAHLHD